MESKLELLSPAGDYEKLLMSVTYGADAVYLAGREFGMRSSAGNFDSDQMKKVIQFCHLNGVKVYVTCNTLPREHEIDRIPQYLEFLDSVGADAVIAADIGVMAAVKKYAPNVKLHMSTQFGVVNSSAAETLYNLGADTVVLARELSLDEISIIRSKVSPKLRLEAFVHGAMCVSFSGRCLLSNYLTGRDSNRGECAQPCRWKYALCEEKRPGEFFSIEEEQGRGTYILNSRDMCMIEHIEELKNAGISSLKIEGRMKSSYYAAAVTNAYRHVIDNVENGTVPDPVWYREVNMVSHRPYSTGFYYGYPGQHDSVSSYESDADVMAIVESCDADNNAVLVQRNKFKSGEALQLLTPDSLPVDFIAGTIYDQEDNVIEDTCHAAMKFKMKLPSRAVPLSIIRKVK